MLRFDRQTIDNTLSAVCGCNIKKFHMTDGHICFLHIIAKQLVRSLLYPPTFCLHFFVNGTQIVEDKKI